MAFKLTKTEKTQFEGEIRDLRDARNKLDTAVAAYNDVLQNARSDLEGALETFREAQANAAQVVADIHERLEAEYENKSDRWKEGENGGLAQAMVENWLELNGMLGGGLDFDEREIAQDIELPDSEWEEKAGEMTMDAADG